MNGPELLEHCGMDAARWAAEFRKTAVQLGYSDMDEGWLIGWFANAIMNTHDILLKVGPMNGDHAEWLAEREKTTNAL
jgi:hypothetical protein